MRQNCKRTQNIIHVHTEFYSLNTKYNAAQHRALSTISSPFVSFRLCKTTKNNNNELAFRIPCDKSSSPSLSHHRRIVVVLPSLRLNFNSVHSLSLYLCRLFYLYLYLPYAFFFFFPFLSLEIFSLFFIFAQNLAHTHTHTVSS